jgi:hypothetical protein
MAYDVGDTAVLNLSVDPHDGTTDATILVTAPDGTTSTPAASTSDGGANWTAQLPVTMAGQWTVKWTVTGTGANVQYDSFDVDPVPPATEAQDDVRLLIADTSTANRIFSTRQIAQFLRLNSGNVRRAAAQALDVIAANEVLVSKVIRTQDLSTDGAKVADALRKQAAELRRQADQGEDDTETSGFEIVEYVPYPCVPERTEWPY